MCLRCATRHRCTRPQGHGESARSTSPASKMPRSFLVKKHFNSSKKPNYSELDTHTGNRTKSGATASLLRLRSLRGRTEEGWDCSAGWRGRVRSLLALFSPAYKEGVLRNIVLTRMNHENLLTHLNPSYLERTWSFPVLYLLVVELKLLFKSFRKFHCFIVSGCTDLEAACRLEGTLQLHFACSRALPLPIRIYV